MDFYDPSDLQGYLLPEFLFKELHNFREEKAFQFYDCTPETLISNEDLLAVARKVPKSKKSMLYFIEYEEELEDFIDQLWEYYTEMLKLFLEDEKMQ